MIESGEIAMEVITKTLVKFEYEQCMISVASVLNILNLVFHDGKQKLDGSCTLLLYN